MIISENPSNLCHRLTIIEWFLRLEDSHNTQYNYKRKV